MTSFETQSVSDRLTLSNFSEFGWGLAGLLTGVLHGELKASGLVSLRSIAESIPADTILLAGNFYVSRDKQANTLVPEVRKLDHDDQGFSLDQKDPTIFIDSAEGSFLALGLPGEVHFSSAFRAFSFGDWNEALWAWAYLNSGLGHSWARRLRAITDASNGRPSLEDSLVLSPVPKNFGKIEAQLRSLAISIGEAAEYVVPPASNYFRAVLSQNAAWSLRPPAQTTTKTNGPGLSDLVERVQKGNAPKGQSVGDLAVTSGQWMSSGLITGYVDGDPELVRAEVGDVITPVLGDRSRARIVDTPMAVNSFHYVLRPRRAVPPERVSSFLNSPSAGKQRMHLVRQGTTLSTLAKADLLSFVVRDAIDVAAECKLLVEQVIN
jgi:hypothetical protein